jgi:glycine dehydrogenase subunit 1
MYLACLGAQGMEKLARLNFDKAEYLKAALAPAGYETVFSAPTFNEFVVKCPPGFDEKHAALLDRGFVAGLPLGPHYPELEGHCLFCVTEVITREDMDRLVEELVR